MIRRVREASYGWVLRNLVLPFGDAAFRQGMMRRLRFLEAAQWWDADRLYPHRDRLLRETLEVAFREVPFHRRLFDEQGLSPADIRTAADLVRLPTVSKEMMRAEYPHGVTRPTGHQTYVTASSGSTGANFFVVEDAPTAGWYRASSVLAFQWAGWRIGEPHMQAGMTTTRSFDRRLKDALLRCHYMYAADLSDAALDANLAILESNRIEHLWGYPGSLYHLAARAEEVGWNRPLRSVVTWGDTLYPHYRSTIERAFRTRVHDTYGCGEGMQISAQCGYGQTYHVHSLDVVVETVDDDGTPVPPGSPGHVLLTRLHPGPMPFVRYRIGDVGTLEASGPCGCGRGFDRMHSIQGRDTDVVVTPDGNRLIVHFFTGILEHFAEIESFQVVQTRPDAITVRVVPASGFSAGTERRIVEALARKGSGSLAIHVEPVAEIPLPPSGKRRFVISVVAPATGPVASSSISSTS
jgi:phenylacetate-CoA ligase